MPQFKSYDSVGTKEDLADKIYNLAPSETPVMNAIGRGTCSQKLFSWQVDTIGDPVDNAVVEGGELAATTPLLAPTTMLSNITQISLKNVEVSGTQEASKHAGRGSELAYQFAKKAKELKLDMEYNLVGRFQAKDVGSATKARKTGNFASFMGHNTYHNGAGSALKGAGLSDGFGNGTTVPVKGTARALTESLVQTMLQDIYAHSSASPNLLIVDAKNKTLISNGFKGRASDLQQTAKDKSVQAVVDFYISDFGTIRVMPSRMIAKEAATNSFALALDTKQWSIDYLRQFKTMDLPKTKDGTTKAIIGEYALRVNNDLSSGAIYDLD